MMAGGCKKLNSSPRESYHKFKVIAIQILYTLLSAWKALGCVRNILMSPLLLDMLSVYLFKVVIDFIPPVVAFSYTTALIVYQNYHIYSHGILW